MITEECNETKCLNVDDNLTDLEDEEIPINPELEKLRITVLQEKSIDYKKTSEELMNLVENIHSSYLFHPRGKEVLAKLCTCITATKPEVYNKSWKDLGDILGLSFQQIGCIENYNRGDFTEMVLKTFSQREDSTLGKITSALYELQRLDALNIAKEHFPGLVKLAEEENTKKLAELNNHFLSNNASLEEMKKIILYPLGYEETELPITLKNNVAKVQSKMTLLQYSSLQENMRRIEKIQKSRPVYSNKAKRYSKKVMLSFASDGADLARTVAATFRKQRKINETNFLPIGVLILDEHRDKVIAHPEFFITHQFQKMDFIVPIITEGYLEAIGRVPCLSSGSVSLDWTYAQLIHNLMTKNYVENGCRNTKVRSVVPHSNLARVLQHPHMLVDPLLRSVFFTDQEVEDLAVRLITYKHKSSKC